MEQNKIQEMQFLEQNLQNLLLQKQAFQMELAETNAALKEIKNAGDEVFKIVGQLMIKSDKKETEKELEKKKELLDLRTKTIEKQETSLTEKVEKLRQEFLKASKEKQK